MYSVRRWDILLRTYADSRPDGRRGVIVAGCVVLGCLGTRPDFCRILAVRHQQWGSGGDTGCNGVAKALRAQVKISVGTNQINEVRTEDFIEQAFEVSQSLTRVQATLIRWRSKVPPLITRLENMIAWAGLPPTQER